MTATAERNIILDDWAYLEDPGASSPDFGPVTYVQAEYHPPEAGLQVEDTDYRVGPDTSNHVGANVLSVFATSATDEIPQRAEYDTSPALFPETAHPGVNVLIGIHPQVLANFGEYSGEYPLNNTQEHVAPAAEVVTVDAQGEATLGPVVIEQDGTPVDAGPETPPTSPEPIEPSDEIEGEDSQDASPQPPIVGAGQWYHARPPQHRGKSRLARLKDWWYGDERNSLQETIEQGVNNGLDKLYDARQALWKTKFGQVVTRPFRAIAETHFYDDKKGDIKFSAALAGAAAIVIGYIGLHPSHSSSDDAPDPGVKSTINYCAPGDSYGYDIARGKPCPDDTPDPALNPAVTHDTAKEPKHVHGSLTPTSVPATIKIGGPGSTLWGAASEQVDPAYVPQYDALVEAANNIDNPAGLHPYQVLKVPKAATQLAIHHSYAGKHRANG